MVSASRPTANTTTLATYYLLLATLTTLEKQIGTVLLFNAEMKQILID